MPKRTLEQVVAATAEAAGRTARAGMHRHFHRTMTQEGVGTPVKTGRLRASLHVTSEHEPLVPPPPAGYDRYAYTRPDDVHADAMEIPMSATSRHSWTAEYAAKVWAMGRYDDRIPAAIREMLADATRAQLAAADRAAYRRQFERLLRTGRP